MESAQRADCKKQNQRPGLPATPSSFPARPPGALSPPFPRPSPARASLHPLPPSSGRLTVPGRLARFQATGSPLRGRAPSGDAPGGLLGAFLFSRDPPLAGELRGCAWSPLQPQVPGALHAALPGSSLSPVLLGRCLLSPLLLACRVWSAPAPRMQASP